MKTVTTKKENCEFTGVNTLVFVNDILVFKLSKIENPIKEGYDSRTKFRVHTFDNTLGIKFWSKTARSIKNVIQTIK
jgi:hypothetical protein